jgi:quercetin dioxygenase-like cupin family protein
MIQAELKTSEELTPKKQELAALTAPLLTFNLVKEIERLRREEHWLKDGRISETLVKYSDFRIVLILMQAGTLMREHKADARISIHCLSGRLMVHLPEKLVELSAGDLLVLEKCLPHDVSAIEESAFLLSISWPHGDEQES